jgi:5-methylcytosine-specific restriction endonuclease McrA
MAWVGFNRDGEPLSKRRLRWWCDDCHDTCGEFIKHSLATPDTPEISREEIVEHERAREEQHRARWAEFERGRRDQAAEWRERYHAHLQSPEWASRRDRVHERAGGICEGCRTRAASETHHLTYRNLGAEFLWELVAVCSECHRRYHGFTDDF